MAHLSSGTQFPSSLIPPPDTRTHQIANEDETCDGVSQNDMGECRMDIVDSELGHLGYDETEGYGISWKVKKNALSFFKENLPLLYPPDELLALSCVFYHQNAALSFQFTP